MTLDKARELLQTQVDFGGFYNRHGARRILAEVCREHGQQAVDRFIVELKLTEVFQFEVGEVFEGM